MQYFAKIQNPSKYQNKYISTQFLWIYSSLYGTCIIDHRVPGTRRSSEKYSAARLLHVVATLATILIRNTTS